MGDGPEDPGNQLLREERGALRLAARAELSRPATEGQQVLGPARGAADSGEASLGPGQASSASAPAGTTRRNGPSRGS